jgi:hypothetical protein
LFLGIGWKIVWIQEFVDQSLVLADTVGKHATMVSIVVDTPLHFHDLVCRVFGDHIAPVSGGLVVINTNSGIISTWSTTANLGSF